MAASPTREAVFSALFTKMQAISLFATASRRMTLPQQIQPGNLPAIMIWEQPEHTKITTGQPAIREWEAWIVVVFKNTDKSIPGATILNPMIDAVEAALAPDDIGRNVNTLGGLVWYCRIDGTTTKETGDTDAAGLGGAVITIKIKVP
ncbi:MAG: hypothetical protein KGL35_03270 [Bradyrhizobium sp.]|nr:hypothetical protein [Bradyrhizobium sp.]